MKIKEFIGRQQGRLKIGSIIISTFYQSVTVALFLKVLLDISNEFLIIIVISGPILAWFVGFFSDKTEISKEETKKIMEQQLEGSRYLNNIILEEVVIPKHEAMMNRVMDRFVEALVNKLKDQ